jgi:sec-independent protein translocase protein TatC
VIKKQQNTIIEHLDELRSVIIKSLISIAILFPVCYYYSLPIIEWLKQFSCLRAYHLVYLQPLELFFTRLKVSFFLSLYVCFPYITFHIWKFVSPALFKNERYYIKRFVILSSLLFIAGACLGLFAVFPAVMNFAVRMSVSNISPMISVSSFTGLAVMLMLGFGLIFQLPIFVYILTYFGLVEIHTMKKSRPVIIISIFVLSAILTPPDLISQLAMALPSIILFEVSLWCASITKRKNLRHSKHMTSSL